MHGCVRLIRVDERSVCHRPDRHNQLVRGKRRIADNLYRQLGDEAVYDSDLFREWQYHWYYLQSREEPAIDE